MQALIIVLKGIAGGLLVCVFALIGESIRPRGLSGITSAAPSVAVASLAVSLLASGVAATFSLALGMIAGAASLVLWCLVGTEAVKRFGALKGSIATTGVWLVSGLSLWAAFLR